MDRLTGGNDMTNKIPMGIAQPPLRLEGEASISKPHQSEGLGKVDKCALFQFIRERRKPIDYLLMIYGHEDHKGEENGESDNPSYGQQSVISCGM